MSALPLHDSGRKLHAAEILVIRIGRVDEHVAEQRVGNAGLDALDQIPIVDGSAQRVLAERRERNGAGALFPLTLVVATALFAAAALRKP
jgi:hypothetical protein